MFFPSKTDSCCFLRSHVEVSINGLPQTSLLFQWLENKQSINPIQSDALGVPPGQETETTKIIGERLGPSPLYV